MGWGRKWLVDFSTGKTQRVLSNLITLITLITSLITLCGIDVKMDGSVLEENSLFKMLGLTCSSKLDWGSYVISIAKTDSKKIGALICSMKFLSH